MTDLIRSLDFCEVISDKFIAEGVKRGHIVYVAGLQPLPISEEDPYTQRIKMLCHLVKDGHVDASKLYIMDPASIQKVSGGKQKKLSDILRKDFLPRDDDVSDSSS